MSPLVSKKACKQIFDIIEDRQREYPREPVTQNQVLAILKKRAYGKSKLSARHVRRVFRELLEDGKIVKSTRGQYWLRENLEKNLAYQKILLESEKKFWGCVDNLRIQKIAELEHMLDVQEQHYEEMIERREVLEELPEPAKEEIIRAKRALSKRK